MSKTQLPLWAEWLRAVGPVLVSSFAVLVSVISLFLSRQIARWQASVARETVRQNYYDRRFDIFMAFRDLLVAVLEKDDLEDELRKANTACAASSFLLNEHLETYLSNLNRDIFSMNARSKLFKNETYKASLTPDQLLIEANSGSYRLELAGRLSELTKRFEPFLKPEEPHYP